MPNTDTDRLNYELGKARLLATDGIVRAIRAQKLLQGGRDLTATEIQLLDDHTSKVLRGIEFLISAILPVDS